MDVRTERRSLFVVVVGALVVVFGVLILASGSGSDDRSEELAVPRTSNDVDANAFDGVEPVDPNSVYDPVQAGEDTPSSYRQLLGRDQIAPIYDPSFTTADGIDWPPDALIVGVTGTETSKAYPVSHLNRREMVIDHIDGDPILVSW
jgi:hypothetical protein